MQMNRNGATVIFIVFMATISIAYALNTIYSPTVSETVGEYTLTLIKDVSEPKLGTILTLTGTLKYAGIGASGQIVHLEQNGETILTNTTLADGTFTFQLNRTATGTFNYRVRFDYP